jgi:hypothetical protein
MEHSANTEFESVVSEDATVQSVPTEETVNDGMTVVGDADLIEMAEDGIEEELELLDAAVPVLEPFIEPIVVTAEELPVVEEVAKLEGYKLKVGDKWFKSWKPYYLVDTEEEATILDADWARGYKSSLKMMKRLNADIIEL